MSGHSLSCRKNLHVAACLWVFTCVLSIIFSPFFWLSLFFKLKSLDEILIWYLWTPWFPVPAIPWQVRTMNAELPPAQAWPAPAKHRLQHIFQRQETLLFTYVQHDDFEIWTICYICTWIVYSMYKALHIRNSKFERDCICTYTLIEISFLSSPHPSPKLPLLPSRSQSLFFF